MTDKQFKIMCIVGARPNFMKIAPVMKAFAAETPSIHPVLLHTGQHYDHAMKALLFDQLGIPVPDIDLEVRGGSHAEQTANIMLRFEPVLLKEKPDALLVVGDVNSTIACALVAIKLHIPVIHVEAGLRSRDIAMPEEINRLLTDRISQLLFTTEKLGNQNLENEGVPAENIRFVGNVMIDSLLQNKAIAPSMDEVIQTYRLGNLKDSMARSDNQYVFVTMHRPSNVDDAATLAQLLGSIRQVADRIPVVFAVHPRTRGNIESFGLQEKLDHPNIHTAPPVGYLDSITLMSNAKLVLTDSGGIQEETTALGVPCLTMRENTERWITVDEGTNTIVGTDHDKIIAEFEKILDGNGKAGRRPDLWDGEAAVRIVREIREWFESGEYVLEKR
ncbi:MAG: UDP-N-acetylglucosamine 2-epimerase (non-hydrolyzing) [Proteobacteria bacterium]|nr:MAG: UDP-N-acetylglucosamine 2-epimerase (non-hydrolyzing) [Pseudomonadota bacterium]